MRFTLPTRFIATLTVVAIAVTAVSAAPAHADDRRVARTAAAILGLAVVGALIHDANKDRSDKYVEPQPRRHVQPRPRVEPAMAIRICSAAAVWSRITTPRTACRRIVRCEFVQIAARVQDMTHAA